MHYSLDTSSGNCCFVEIEELRKHILNLTPANRSADQFSLRLALLTVFTVKGVGKRGHIVADTLLLMTFLGRANVRDTK